MNNLKFNVTKATGEKEPFSYEAYSRSLLRAGLSESEIKDIFETIKPQLHDGITTQKLYYLTFEQVSKKSPVCAMRYSLKESLRRLGPTGFPFERLVAAIFHHEGYEVQVDQTLKGKCVSHETDIVGIKDKSYLIVEVKFHIESGLRSPVKTALYVKARFDDIKAVNPQITGGLLATNTKFSDDSITYAQCVGLGLLGWGYPPKHGLDVLINKYRLFPITTITSLKQPEIRLLLDANIVLCKDIPSNLEELKKLGIRHEVIDAAHEQCKALCG